MLKILEELINLVRERKKNSPDNSYTKKLGISTDSGKGYRTLSNISENGGQEVPHLHFHLFGGEKVGRMVE